jgi:hypothetical protein
MEREINDWSVYYAGFVKKKNVFGIFFSRYAVLDDTTLVFYEDETESNEKERYSISTNWMIEPIAGFDFKLADSTNSSVNIIISTEKFEHLEAWLLALTQSINGPYRDSENFCSAERTSSSASSTDHQRFDCHFPSESTNVDFSDPSFVLSSCLYKQDSNIIFTKSWKKIWCRLQNNSVLEYSDNEDFSNKTSVFLNDQSKIIRLPENFQGQRYGLSVLTTEVKKDSYRSLRLATFDEDLLHTWADFLNYCIDCYNRDRFALLSPPSDLVLSSSSDSLLSRQPFHISQRESAATDGVHTTASNSADKPNKFKKSNTTAFYVNDETARARIQRFISPNKRHSNVNSDLQTLYWDHFCTPVPDSPYVIVEVFEHQRFGVFPRRGFNVLNLFFSDPSKLSNHSGVKYPDRYLKRAEPPAGYRWVAEGEVSGVVQSPHEVLALLYSPDGWSTHPSYRSEDTDESGWTYGTSFEHLRRRCSEGRSRACPNTTDVVRRRRWLRVATNFEEPNVVGTIFSNLGAYLERQGGEGGPSGDLSS